MRENKQTKQEVHNVVKDAMTFFIWCILSTHKSYHLLCFSTAITLVKPIISPLGYCSRTQTYWLLFLLPFLDIYHPFSIQCSKWPLKTKSVTFSGLPRLQCVELCHSKVYVHLGPQNKILFGIKVCEDVIERNHKMRSSWMRVDSNPKDRCSFKRERHRDRGKKALWRKREKLELWCHKPRDTKKAKAGRCKQVSSSRNFWECNLPITLFKTMNFCYFEPQVLWWFFYGSPRKLMQTVSWLLTGCERTHKIK